MGSTAGLLTDLPWCRVMQYEWIMQHGGLHTERDWPYTAVEVGAWALRAVVRCEWEVWLI